LRAAYSPGGGPCHRSATSRLVGRDEALAQTVHGGLVAHRHPAAVGADGQLDARVARLALDVGRGLPPLAPQRREGMPQAVRAVVGRQPGGLQDPPEPWKTRNLWDGSAATWGPGCQGSPHSRAPRRDDRRGGRAPAEDRVPARQRRG
jgi:hypothetical protein